MNPDPDRKPTLREKLLKLQREYGDNVPQRLEYIQDKWQLYLNDGSEDALKQVIGEIHKMAGTATTYGFAELGQRASLAEDVLIDLQDGVLQEESVVMASRAVENLVTFQVLGKVVMQADN